MNCFEAKNDFVAFWRKALAENRRAELLAHLQRCPTCDRSFRAFALTAPVLYSAAEPEWDSEPARPTGIKIDSFDRPTKPSVVEDRPPIPRINRVLSAFLVAAAATIAIYVAAQPPVTFEDAIAADTSNAEVVSYPLADSFFGQELMAQNATAQDSVDQ